MPERENYLTDADVVYQKGINRRFTGERGSTRPPPKRRRGRGGDSISIILAQVDDSDGVASGDATYLFKNAVAIKGTAPADGTGTAQNTFGETLVDEQFILLIQGSDGLWYPDRASGTGAQLIHFELTQDKGYADQAKLAKPILSDGTLDSGADAFYVVDPDPDGEGQFYGLAAYTDGDSGAATHRGYSGIGLKFTEDWDSTGIAGWRIVAMEGPAQELIVGLQASYSMGGTHCTRVDIGPFGEPFGARLPRIENASYTLTVYDDLDVASDAQVGNQWWIIWDRKSEHYIFREPVQPAAATGGGMSVGLLVDTVPALTSLSYTPTVTVAGTPGELDDAVVYLPNWPGLSGGILCKGYNFSLTDERGSSSEPVFIAGMYVAAVDDEPDKFYIAPFDLRRLPNYVVGDNQSVFHKATEPDFQLDGEDCE